MSLGEKLVQMHFLYHGRTAVARGIGEQLQPIKPFCPD